MINQSKELTGFYIAYNRWLEDGAPNMKPFYKDCGLCRNLESYFVSIDDVCKEMKQQFKDAGVDSSYPFGGQRVFDEETYTKTMHLNPDRIKWVKEHLS